MALPVVQYIPAWNIDWSMTVGVDTLRAEGRGPKLEFNPTVYRKNSGYGKSNYIARTVSASRRLRRAECWWLEWFLHDQCRNATMPFTDTYLKFDGTTATGAMRIIDGAYNVSTNGVTYNFSCSIHIYDQQDVGYT